MTKHKFVHIELSSRSHAEMKKFYTQLFGWQTQDMPEMNYVTFAPGPGEEEVGGGFAPITENTPAGTVLVFVSTDDLKASIAKAEKLGAKIILPSQEVPGMGTFGVFIDPSGNQIGLWQSAGQM